MDVDRQGERQRHGRNDPTIAAMDEPNVTRHVRARTLMTVHAHPDDETVGTAGVMARAAVPVSAMAAKTSITAYPLFL